MMNLETFEQLVLPKEILYYPFRSDDVCSFILSQGSCILWQNEKQQLGKIFSDDMVLVDEFLPEETAQIAIQPEEDSIINIVKKSQKETLTFKYENIRRYIRRIKKSSIQTRLNEASVFLFPASSKAKKAFNGNYSVLLSSFPFQVGRFSKKRFHFLNHKNDMYLFDKNPYQISRMHFQIEQRGEIFFYRDLGSKMGSWVNGKQLSKHSQLNELQLSVGLNKIVLGKKTGDIMLSLLIK